MDAMNIAKRKGGCPVHGMEHIIYDMEKSEFDSELLIKPKVNKHSCYCIAKIPDPHDLRGYSICCYSFEKRLPVGLKRRYNKKR